MKEIRAIIQPGRLYPVMTAIRDLPGSPAFATSEIRGFPRGHADPLSRSHGIDAIDSFEMVRVECIVQDEEVEGVVEAIRRAAHTGAPGDGKIFVYDVEAAIAIRTGTRGPAAV